MADVHKTPTIPESINSVPGVTTLEAYMKRWDSIYRFLRNDMANVFNSFIRLDGTTPLEGNWDVGDYNITNINNLSANGDVSFGDGTNQVSIDSEGDTIFQGTAGLPFAEIYFHDASTAQSIPTGATYTKSNAFTTNGQSNNCVADADNDKITVTIPGKYLVTCSISAMSGTANVNFLAAVFVDGTEQDDIHWRRKFGTANDEGSMVMSGIVDVTSAPKDIDIRIRHDNIGSINFTGTYGNLSVVQIGGT